MAKTVLVTGSEGFVGRNLCATLERLPELAVLKVDVHNAGASLPEYVGCADYVVHLAGVNRPTDTEAFKTGNVDFTARLLSLLRGTGRRVPVVLSSSTQAAADNPYGISKRQAEEAVFAYGREAEAGVCVYRLPNVFGKWCRPNYNSAVATWCHNIACGLPIQVRDPEAALTLVYVDDVVSEFVAALSGWGNRLADGYCSVPVSYTRTLGQITGLLYGFKSSRQDLQVPDQADGFTKKLYATYLSYLPPGEFSYPLKMKVDARGSFSEFIRTLDRGQVSVNISKPHVIKGQHWHHTKHEKFLVVAGQGVIRFRSVAGAEQAPGGAPSAQGGAGVLEYFVGGDKLEVVEVPPGYTHNIENLGETDMVTVMWANEAYDPQRPDTYFEKV